ncbi:MAG: hypothetical protein KA035_00380 [Candidatus Levybacteria bacterium]|nr:hypothetical protein [Candidatus Levybacteria bacterium]
MPLKTILKEWNYDDRGFNPDLSYARSEFYWNLISTQPTDEQERIIALKGLSNGYLLRLIEGNGGVSSEVSKTILEAGTLLVAFDDQFGDRFQDYVSPFKKRVRESLLYSIDPSLVQGDMEPPSIDQYVVVAQEIAKHPEDTLRISYLSHGEVIDRMIQLRDNPDKIAQFVKAYEACPELVTNDALLDHFAKQFEGEQTTVFFKRFVDVSGNLSRENMTLLLEWVGEKKLTQDRVISLASRIDTIPKEILKIVVEAPGLFLASDDGLLLADHIKQGTVLEMGEELDKKAGKLFQAFERNNNSLPNPSIAKELSALILRGDTLVKDGVYKKVDRSNWKQMLALYVRTQVPLRMHEISEETNAFIREEFGKSEVKDLIMQNMRSEWTSYLTGEGQAMPYSLYLLTHFIDAVGVGPLSQVEAFASLMSSVRRADSKSTTTDKTRSEITQGLLNIENRFVKERWSNEDRTGFYASSKDIIDVSPSLYSEYLSLFEACSQQQLKQFNREIYPLHRAILALSATRDADGTNHYNSRDLVSIRHDIQNLKNLVGNDPEVFVKEKDRLIGGLKELFQDRFGIKEIPEEFTNEHIRSLTNVSLYVANLSERNTQNEAVLGFYLALTMNEKWEELREGNAPTPDLFMTSEKTAIISPLLQERASNPVLSAKELGIEEAQFHDFMKALQAETEEMTITSTQTVDVKLINIIRNLSGFEDPDFYENPMDKARMQLLLTYGNKQVGQTAAKLFLSFANPDKAKPFTKEEEAVRDAIVKSMESSGIDVNAENIKMHMQDGLKPFATISNLMNTMRDLKVESTVDDLQSQLVPSKNIVEIFARLGEEFTHTSGAMALSNDLNYLDSLVVRKSDLLTPPEMEQLQEYIHGIREQVVTLESVYEQVQNKFKSASQSLKGAVAPAIEERFAEIDLIFNNSLDSQVIISTVSHDLDVIIENMRECLSCTKQGVNNDTNLTFGDPNKFYVYTSVEGKPGSISDQVTFLSPVTRTNGTTEMAFVFDRLYGANTPVVLENQVAAVLKKYKELKTLFPDAKLSLFVTDAAMFTGGISPELFAHALEEYEVSIVEEELEVNVKPSVFNQPYVEFGGGFRSPGPRTVKGLTLR